MFRMNETGTGHRGDFIYGVRIKHFVVILHCL
jgi:hypothetical protein